MPKIAIKVGCQVSHVGRHIEEPAGFFVCQRLSIFPDRKRCASLRMTRLLILLRLLRMTSFVRDAEVAFSSYFSRLLSANSTQYMSFRVELKMANSKWTYRRKIRAFISFFDSVSCCLIQVQHRIRKKMEI